MTIDYQQTLAHVFPVVEHTYTERDAMLYALSVGFGRNPADFEDLPFVYERELRVAPTMAVTLGFRSIRDAGLGIDYRKVVHGEHSLELHAPLPSSATVLCTTRVTEVVDRGADKGAILYLERTLIDKATGMRLATSTMTAFCRGDGGFGGPVTSAPRPHAIPDRPADAQLELQLPGNAALLYRLSGDYNPLHVDPEAASAAGFSRPILHGLQVYGEVGRVLLRGYAGNDPGRFAAMACRFTGTAFPGDRLRLSLWQDAGCVSFQAVAEERRSVVLDNGRALLP